jgi:hypothetical protein
MAPDMDMEVSEDTADTEARNNKAFFILVSFLCANNLSYVMLQDMELDMEPAMDPTTDTITAVPVTPRLTKS